MNKKKSAMPVSTAKTAYGLLSEVRRLILEEPKRYNQCDWLTRRSDYPHLFGNEFFPPCGTVACVAGWVATLTTSKFCETDSSRIAGDVLGLDACMAGELFSGGAADGEPQSLEHAENGAAHIARFQKKYAKQLKAKRLA